MSGRAVGARFGLFVLCAVLFVMAGEVAAVPLSGRTPPPLQYHGPTTSSAPAWWSDVGHYSGWQLGGVAGTANAMSVWAANVGRVPITINGTQVATAASIAAALMPYARAVGQANLAVQVLNAVYDIATGIWNIPGSNDQSGSTVSGPCSYDTTNGSSSCNVFACDTMAVGTVLYNPTNHSACVRVPSTAHGCSGSGPAGFTNFARYVADGSQSCGWTSTWVKAGYVHTSAHTATDTELTTGIANGLAAQPSTAPSAAAQAEANGATVTLGDVALTGPTPLQGPTDTATTTAPGSTITTTNNTVYNMTYGPTSNVYNNMVTTTTTNNNGVTTTTTNNANAPAGPTNNSPNPPTECGSLSCESTQQAIKTELQAAAAPTLADQTAAIASAKTADNALSAAASAQITSEFAADRARWFAFSWTTPGGSCTAPTASLSNGRTVSFDYCPWVGNVQAILGWLFAIFGAWHVYGTLFRGRND